ncbi:helix-turn-helix domain-containing protein [Pseudonocardia asaccharolytica]|uniref:helix-turn-helix domain-containing protein n=1 Tax=Pseudonocardia asaccharolytica TaxID=54010 RepID=UPI001378132D|nr:XRE family transcriptional regulator [Pseudonocardia asaccharolytica]
MTSTEQRLTVVPDRLHAARARRGWTLHQAAARCGLSAAHLSRLESGARLPSVSALLQLADAYAVPVARLLGDDSPHAADPAAVLRGAEVRVVAGDGMSCASLTAALPSPLIQALRVTVHPDRERAGFARHPGEEWLYALSGLLWLDLDDDRELLAAGDVAHFDAGRAHRLGAADGSPATALLVVAASRTELAGMHR